MENTAQENVQLEGADRLDSSHWFVYETTPRFSDTDAYSIVHHSNFFKWLEEARFAFARDRLGMRLNDMNSHEVQILVLECRCRFLTPVHYGDPMLIKLYFKLNKTAKFEFHYQIWNSESMKKVADAFTSHVYVRRNGQLLLNHPKWLIERVMDAKHRFNNEIIMQSTTEWRKV